MGDDNKATLFFPSFFLYCNICIFTFPKFTFHSIVIVIKLPCSIYSLILRLEIYRQGLHCINIVLWMGQLTQSDYLYYFSNFMTSLCFHRELCQCQVKIDHNHSTYEVILKLGHILLNNLFTLWFLFLCWEETCPFHHITFQGLLSVLWKLDSKR